MSATSFFAGRELRKSTEQAKLGRRAGRKFVENNERKDKLWFGGALQELQYKVDKTGLPTAAGRLKKSTDKALGDNPVSEGLQAITDPSSWATDYLKGNLPAICLRGSVSLAVFHEFKHRGVKRVARRYSGKSKCIQPITNYICDVLLPTPLYGPFFILLMRKGSEWLISKVKTKTGLEKPKD